MKKREHLRVTSVVTVTVFLEEKRQKSDDDTKKVSHIFIWFEQYCEDVDKLFPYVISSPSSNLLYSAISLSSLVLMSSSTW